MKAATLLSQYMCILLKAHSTFKEQGCKKNMCLGFAVYVLILTYVREADPDSLVCSEKKYLTIEGYFRQLWLCFPIEEIFTNWSVFSPNIYPSLAFWLYDLL